MKIQNSKLNIRSAHNNESMIVFNCIYKAHIRDLTNNFAIFANLRSSMRKFFTSIVALHNGVVRKKE